MSFPKARIQRFNELENDVPAPGAYDPKFDTKVKGVVLIEKSERFHDDKSVASAECSLSVCTRSIHNVKASFRTPQLPRKKNRDQHLRTKSKPRAIIPVHDQKLKYDSQHHLADLQVECSNKDRTIQEQEKHIEDMKEEVQRLQLKLEELSKKQIQMEEQHKKDMEAMAELQQEVLSGHDEKYQSEVETLRRKLLEASEEKEREIQAREVVEDELKCRIAGFSRRVTALESKLVNSKFPSEGEIHILETQIDELTIKLQKSTDAHKKEMSLLTQEKSELSSRVDNLNEEREKLESQLQKRQNEILDLQALLSGLQSELDQLKAEHEKLVENSAKQIDDLKYKRQVEIEKLKLTFEEEKATILAEYKLEIARRKETEAKARDANELNNCLKKELEDVKRLYEDVNNRLGEAHQELEESDKKYNIVIKKHQDDLVNIIRLHEEEKFKLNNQLEHSKQNYLKEIENLKVARDIEITELKELTVKKIEDESRRIKQHADKIVENAEAVTRETLAACRAECNERVKKIIAENDVKSKDELFEKRRKRETFEKSVMQEVQKNKSRREALEDENKKLIEHNDHLLKNYEEISEKYADVVEKLKVKDAESAALSVTLEQLRSSAETQESFSQSLQMELDRAETDLAEKKAELKALKDHIRAETAEMVARRKRFEIVMTENQASVAALTKRLAQSNAEVESLQYELNRAENCISEQRNLLSVMRNNSHVVHEQLLTLMKQMDAKRGLIDQLEIESISDIESLKSMFETKIDELKQIATNEVARLQAECATKAAENAEMKNQLHEMANHLREAQNMLLKLEETNDTQQIEISRVELYNTKLSEKLKEREEIVTKNDRLLEKQIDKYETALNEANSKIQDLGNKIKVLEEKNKTLEEKAELFGEERSKQESFEKTIIKELEENKLRREAVEEKNKTLTEYNEQLIKNYQEINERYAELVGHHNHRQRIKHLSQLKDKISQLEQDLNSKIKIIEHQQKIIEKLKTEEKRAHFKGKENVLSISKSSTTTPVSSPHKSLTPLRSRND